MSAPFPLIKVTVEHMRQEILNAFSSYQLEATSQLDTALKAAITEFDFTGEVRRVANNLLTEMVQELVKNAVTSIRYDQVLTKKLNKLIASAVKANLYKS